LIISSLLTSGFFSPGIPDSNRESDLFRILRSRDANEIIYKIKFDQTGRPDRSDPIEIHWLKRTDNNKVEPLTRIQNRYAYGIRVLDIADKKDEIYFKFVSYDKRTFVLKKNGENNYKVFTLSGEKEVEVSRIFIQIDGGSFWLPTISRVELHSKEPGSGKLAMETINP
jgi:hypothetical protein